MVQEIKPEQVLSVYSGRPGCACGCRGTHKYNPEHRQEAIWDLGYDPGADSFSARSIKVVLTKVKNLHKVNPGSIEYDSDRVISAEDKVKGRVYVIYLTSEEKL